MIKIVFLIEALIIIGCNSKPQPVTKLTEEEYDIYSTIISHRFGILLRLPKDSNDTLYLSSKTSAFDIVGKGIKIKYSLYDAYAFPVDTLKSFYPLQDWDSLVTQFKYVTKDSVNIDPSKLNSSFKYSLIKGNIFMTPNIIGFSRVGFNTQRDKALVYYFTGEIETVNEYVLLLEKKNNHWEIVGGYGAEHGMMKGFRYY